jgi:hypothetical protein
VFFCGPASNSSKATCFINASRDFEQGNRSEVQCLMLTAVYCLAFINPGIPVRLVAGAEKPEACRLKSMRIRTLVRPIYWSLTIRIENHEYIYTPQIIPNPAIPQWRSG